MAEYGQDVPARPATLREVALRAGVDVSTASRALSGRRRVSQDVATRVHEAASTLGYSPNGPARNLRLARTMTLGMVSSRFSNPTLFDFMEGLSSVVEAHDYSLMLTFTQGDPEHYRKLVRRLFERRVDGLFIASPPDLTGAYALYRGAGVPVITLFGRGRGPEDTPLLTATEEAAIDASVARLRALGHRRVLYVGVPTSIPSVRLTWLEEASQRSGVRLEVETLSSAADDPLLQACLPVYLRGPERVTAIYIHAVDLPRLMNVLNGLGVHVPDDLSVVAFGESPWTVEFGFRVASIRHDMRSMGEAAGNAMIGWLGGDCPPAEIVAGAAEWIEHPSIGPAGTQSGLNGGGQWPEASLP